MRLDIPETLDVAVQAAHAAGEKLLEGSGLRQVNFISSRDVKLQADLESEALVRQRLSEATGLPIIGEEHGGDEGLLEAEEPYWVVDPLDGTHNYLREMGLCCVSIGLMRGLRPVLGVIHDFNTGQTWTAAAEAGIGLHLNGSPVVPQWAQDEATAVLCTGFPAAMDTSTANLQCFVERVQRFKKIRMLGSAALAMAYVASGKCDLYSEQSVRLWDIAGGMALAMAAGAALEVERVPGLPFGCNIGVAGKSAWLKA
jgi:myo-inositol-1(or 4)-monophosphatase